MKDVGIKGSKIDRRRPASRWRGVLRFRFELALFVLLLATIAAAVFQDALTRRTIDITPATAAQYSPNLYADALQGGSSRAEPTGPMAWRCRLTPPYIYRYCVFELQFDPRRVRGLDLSRLDAARILLDYRGPADTIRIYLKNVDPRYSRPGQADTDKFNMTELMVRRGRNVIDLRLADFRVAEWWVHQQKVPLGLSQPQFDNVVALQFQTGTRAEPGDYALTVREITIENRILKPVEIYAGLLALWAILVGGFLVARIITLNRDLDRRREAQDAAVRIARNAEETARRDHLTRLLNRAGVSDLYHSLAIRRRDGDGFALMLIDIDHFKRINDVHGHVVGDTVLAAVGQLLTANTRADDIVGRWGGEEFIVICNASDAETARNIAEKLRQAVAGHDFTIGVVTCSIGVYRCAGFAQELEVAVACADAALYAAKARGRDLVVMHEPGLARAAIRS